MKKLLLVLLLVPTITNAQIKTDFKIGDRGQEVKELQKFLKVTPQTGYFGSKTRLALDKYLKTVKVTTIATTTPKIENKATSTDTTTPIVRPHTITWNFQIATSTKNYYQQSVELRFSPIWNDTFTAPQVTRCEYFSTLETTDEGGKHIIQYSGTGKVNFDAIVYKSHITTAQCVAFDFQMINGVKTYTEYKSEVLYFR